MNFMLTNNTWNQPIGLAVDSTWVKAGAVFSSVLFFLLLLQLFPSEENGRQQKVMGKNKNK